MALNVEQVRDKLLEQFEKIEKGNADLEKAKEMNRTAQNILHSAKVELQYSKMHEKKRVIDFLEQKKKK